jgi:hypothetical protein
MTIQAAGSDRLQDSQSRPTRIEALALKGLRIGGLLGSLFALLTFPFIKRDLWQVSAVWPFLMLGGAGLWLSQCWAAVLVSGFCWFALSTCLLDDVTGKIGGDELIFLGITLAAALGITILTPLCSRHLQNGLWIRPVGNRPAAVISVSAGLLWLLCYLHALIAMESPAEAHRRIAAFTITVLAALLAGVRPRSPE